MRNRIKLLILYSFIIVVIIMVVFLNNKNHEKWAKEIKLEDVFNNELENINKIVIGSGLSAEIVELTNNTQINKLKEELKNIILERYDGNMVASPNGCKYFVDMFIESDKDERYYIQFGGEQFTFYKTDRKENWSPKYNLIETGSESKVIEAYLIN